MTWLLGTVSIALAAPPSLPLRVHLTADSLAISGQSAGTVPGFIAASAAASPEAEAAYRAAAADMSARESALAALRSMLQRDGSTPALLEELDQAAAALTASTQTLRQAEAALRESIMDAMSPPLSGVDRELVRRYAASADRAVPAHYRVLTLDDATWKLLQSATARVAAGQSGELTADEAETLAQADANPDVQLAKQRLTQHRAAIEAALAPYLLLELQAQAVNPQ